MSAEIASTYKRDPLYQLALRHLQEGEWEAGLAEVDWLVERYPLDHELRGLRQDLLLRAKIDRDERAELAVEKRGRVRKLTRRATIFFLLAIVLVWAGRTYSIWLQGQLETARQRLADEVQVVELTAKIRDADALMRADRPAEAQALLNEVAAVRPDLPGLAESRSRLESALHLESLYQEALTALERHDWETAEAALQDLLAREPSYRDAQLQLEHAQTRLALDDRLTEAEAAFAAANWAEAAAIYESIHSADRLYLSELIEERLFTSYVNAGRAVLLGQADSLEALTTAEAYFRRALALRPQDPEIKAERELARLYLQAQADFSSGRWSEVITALEVVHSHDPGYADGTARQTLFEAHMARGEAFRSAGEYESALVHYQSALTLAEQAPDSALRLFEAHLKVAEAYVSTANFDAAIAHFRSAADTGGLRARAQRQPNLEAALQEAEAYAQAGNMGVAAERYRQAMRIADETKPTEVHIVEPGEYLTLLASRYGSTVKAIVQANEITNPNRIYPGQELIIPVLP